MWFSRAAHGCAVDAPAARRVGSRRWWRGTVLRLARSLRWSLANWQVGYLIPKGGYQKLKDAGAEALRQAVARVAPPVKYAVQHLKDWSAVDPPRAAGPRCGLWL